MDQAVKAKWVAALRSGEYEQGHESLQRAGKFCCLGVLCDLYAKEKQVPFDRNLCASGGDDELPSVAVCEWAGLDDSDPEVEIAGVLKEVSVHNDGPGIVDCKTFAQIADAIEGQL